MTLDDINNLDFNNFGEWPKAVKMVMAGILFVALLIATYFFYAKAEYKQLANLETQESQLKDEYQLKQQQAALLPQYQDQLDRMERELVGLLQKLPDSAEVAQLLVDVSQTGLAAGLEFELFRPEAEIPQAFYSELPIRIKTVGTYHQMGAFVSGLAAMPRVVTMHDIKVYPVKAKDSDRNDLLVMEALAKTYKYNSTEGKK